MPQPKDGEQYDQVSLAHLNAEVEQHRKVELQQVRANYDDIAAPRLNEEVEQLRRAQQQAQGTIQQGRTSALRENNNSNLSGGKPKSRYSDFPKASQTPQGLSSMIQ